MSTMQEAEKLLAHALQDGIRRCARLGYVPAYFIRMVDEDGPLGAVRRLLAAGQVSEGFERFYDLGHLELTVEAIALRPEFSSLFTPPELALARDRLHALGYSIPGK